MKTIQKLNFLIRFYLTVLLFLLLCVCITPMIIQHNVSVTPEFIVKEDILETILILVLLGISYLIFKGFKLSLSEYERAVAQAGANRSKLALRLAEAFDYIGTVNVEMQEIRSILCGVDHYPQTKKEFKQFIDRSAETAMVIAGTPWIVIRLIQQNGCQTVKEYAFERQKGSLPTTTIGNRAILRGESVDGIKTVSTHRKNMNLMTVCILPEIGLSEENMVLIKAVANQIEVLFLLYRSGVLLKESIKPFFVKDIDYD